MEGSSTGSCFVTKKYEISKKIKIERFWKKYEISTKIKIERFWKKYEISTKIKIERFWIKFIAHPRSIF